MRARGNARIAHIIAQSHSCTTQKRFAFVGSWDRGLKNVFIFPVSHLRLGGRGGVNVGAGKRITVVYDRCTISAAADARGTIACRSMIDDGAVFRSDDVVCSFLTERKMSSPLRMDAQNLQSVKLGSVLFDVF